MTPGVCPCGNPPCPQRDGPFNARRRPDPVWLAEGEALYAEAVIEDALAARTGLDDDA